MRKKLELQECLDIIHETAEPLKTLIGTDPLLKFLSDYTFSVSFNANDLFAWACADSVDVAIEDLPKMLEMEKKFGSDGVNALLSLIEDTELQEPCITEKYKEAKEYLKGYRPASWVH